MLMLLKKLKKTDGPCWSLMVLYDASSYFAPIYIPMAARVILTYYEKLTFLELVHIHLRILRTYPPTNCKIRYPGHFFYGLPWSESMWFSKADFWPTS